MSACAPSLQYTKLYQHLMGLPMEGSLRINGVVVASQGAAVPGQAVPEEKSAEVIVQVQLADQLHLEVDGPLATTHAYHGLRFVGKMAGDVLESCEAPSRDAKLIMPQGVSCGNTGAVTSNYFFVNLHGKPCPPDDGSIYVYELHTFRLAKAAPGAGGGGVHGAPVPAPTGSLAAFPTLASPGAQPSTFNKFRGPKSATGARVCGGSGGEFMRARSYRVSQSDAAGVTCTDCLHLAPSPHTDCLRLASPSSCQVPTATRRPTRRCRPPRCLLSRRKSSLSTGAWPP